jgi:transposase
LQEGYTQEFVSKILNVGTTSIKRWKAEIENYGSIKCNYDVSTRTPSKLQYNALLDYYEKNPDALLKETAEHFKCTPQAIFYACERYAITYKKKSRVTRKERNNQEKNIYE